MKNAVGGAKEVANTVIDLERPSQISVHRFQPVADAFVQTQCRSYPQRNALAESGQSILHNQVLPSETLAQ